MKTSVIDVDNMLSVLSLEEVEKRIGEVPGVESVTVNYAARNATTRYDETRLDIADIKSAVRQRGFESADAASSDEAHEAHTAPDASPPAATPKANSELAHAEVGAPATEANTHAAISMHEASPTPKPKSESAASAAKATDHKGHASPASKKTAMSDDMAHEMGHGGNMDLPAMVRDMRNRFWICLVFTIPIFIYSPMGGMFQAPAPPFGLPLNQWLFGFASAAILYPSWPFFVSAWRSLKKGVLNMATLIVLSVGTGYLFSVGATFLFKGEQFFEAVAVLLVFILLGHWLEMRARAGASSAIKALMDLTPAKAFVIRDGAIDRNFIARPDHHNVAYHNFRSRHFAFGTVAYYERLRGRQIHQCFYG